MDKNCLYSQYVDGFATSKEIIFRLKTKTNIENHYLRKNLNTFWYLKTISDK